MAVKDWSTSASSNASVGGVNIAENMARSDVNNAIRAVMAEAKAGFNSFGTISVISTTAAAAANATTLNAETLALSAAGGGTITIAPGVYPYNGQVIIRDNVHIVAKGVTLSGAGVYLYAAQGTGADYWSVDGLTILTDTTENFGGFRLFDITHFRLLNFTFRRTGSSDGYTGMLITASYGEISNFEADGSSDMWIEGHDLTFTNGVMTSGNNGGDDCLAIKAPYISVGEPRASAYNITVSNWIANGYAAGVAIGSEIGYYTANDSTYARFVRGVTVSNFVARNCSRLAFIKPGGNTTNDYRDGTVENVVFSNCTHIDKDGENYQAFVDIIAGRGARVRNIYFNNCTTLGRAQDGIPTNTGVFISPYDYTGGTAATTIENIFFNGIAVTDTYGGAPNGGSAPGQPLDYGVYIERNIGSGGTAPVIGRIEFTNFKLDGCRRNAVYTGTGITGPVKFRNSVLKNFCHTGDAALDRGAFGLNSVVDVKDIEASLSASAPAGSRAILSDNWTPLSVAVNGDQEPIPIGELAAGATTYRSFVAPRDCWIRRIELVNRAAIAADATNKITITADNKDTSANLTTKDTNTGFAYSTAWIPTSIAGADQFTGANSILTKGKALDFAVVSGGTATLAGAALIVHYVPYGAA